MKISYNWLKEYIDIDMPAEDLAEILTNTGLEVEKVNYIETIPGGLKGLVVGVVLEKAKHPNADRLSVAKVDVNSGEILNIVCGASNLEAGQKVVVATVGTTIYPTEGEPFTIKRAKLRGEESLGMICAEDEIGLGTSHEGIMVLDENIKIGTPLAKLYKIENDVVFEIGLTPNRSDAMSHLGVARDIVAALNATDGGNRKLKQPKIETVFNTIETDFKIEVKNTEKCPRYSGIVLKNITVNESPNWLKNKLLAVDVNPINNVVDITNYVLKELGQPLHAFDLAAVKNNTIVVRNAKEDGKFISLDGKERVLNTEDLMICNPKEAMCIAGVFGGAHSGVSNSTNAIFLESAYFNSTTIRKTSTTHDLRTDAAQRYEKGADADITIYALQRAVDLLVKYANATVSSSIFDEYPTEIKKSKVLFNLNHLNSLAGHNFEPKTVKNILADLDIEITAEKDSNLTLSIPLYRADVNREADVIEEIMRIFGYNNIAIPNTVHSTLSFTKGIDINILKEKVANTLNGLGFSEIMTNSITQSKYYEEGEALVHLQNSMTKELDSMRASLIPEALNVIRHNVNRKSGNLKFFEFGNVYSPERNQKEQLAIYLTGKETNENWINKAKDANIYQLKGVVDSLFNNLGLQNISISQENQKLHYTAHNKEIAVLNEVNTTELNKFDLKQKVYVAVLNWETIYSLLNNKKTKFSQLSRFPQVNRDLAIVVDEELKFEDLKQKIYNQNNNFLKSIELFDIFRDENKIGKNKKSYALSFTLQDANKTLTDSEIDEFINNTILLIEKEFKATIRK